MGSDLSFEDMTNRDIEEYEYILSDENASCEEKENYCYKLISKPKDLNSEYSYHTTWITKDNLLAVKEECALRLYEFAGHIYTLEINLCSSFVDNVPVGVIDFLCQRGWPAESDACRE